VPATRVVPFDDLAAPAAEPPRDQA
jgi:hypothetical protein